MDRREHAGGRAKASTVRLSAELFGSELSPVILLIVSFLAAIALKSKRDADIAQL